MVCGDESLEVGVMGVWMLAQLAQVWIKISRDGRNRKYLIDVHCSESEGTKVSGSPHSVVVVLVTSTSQRE
jgi:hypothetical protein